MFKIKDQTRPYDTWVRFTIFDVKVKKVSYTNVVCIKNVKGHNFTSADHTDSAVKCGRFFKKKDNMQQMTIFAECQCFLCMYKWKRRNHILIFCNNFPIMAD